MEVSGLERGCYWGLQEGTFVERIAEEWKKTHASNIQLRKGKGRGEERIVMGQRLQGRLEGAWEELPRGFAADGTGPLPLA